MLKSYVQLVIKDIINRRLRSLLTVVGIIIGITAIVSLFSVGQGLDNAIREQFEKIGSNKIFVYAKGAGDPSSRTGLTDKDADVLEAMSEFVYVTPYLIDKVNIEYANEKYFVNVIGYPDDDAEKRLTAYDVTLQSGRYFTKGEERVMIIGDAVSNTMFGKTVRLNSNLKLNSIKYRVIGIFDTFGNPEDDNSLFIPLDDARNLLEKKDQLTMIELTLDDGVALDQTVRKVKRNLLRKRGNDNFEVVTPDQILKQFGIITVIIQVVLVGIGFISLIVGGIGIMNSMYTSVMERTRQIGIMKAIGASNSTIMLLFLLEAGFLGLIGGIIGAVLGAAVGVGVGKLAAAAGFSLLKIKVNYGLILFSILFSAVVGALSGALPSRQASKLKPIDALRH